MAKGDKAPDFVSYYDKYKKKILNYFWYRVNFDMKTAEDLTSEVFIKALENFYNFDHTGSFQAWIFTISRNHLINFYRVSGRLVPLEDAGFVEDNAPTKKVELEHELEKIFETINSMPAYHRDVLLLRYVDALSNEEIANVLEKDEGAVRTQVSRSMAELRKLLDKRK